MGVWDTVKDVGSATLGLATGGLAGNEDFGFVDNMLDAGSDYLRGPGRAAAAQQEAAKGAQGYVQDYGDRALSGYENVANMGMDNMNAYSNAVGSGQFGTDPSQFQTGQYGAQQYGQNAPGFQQFQQGQAPGYNQVNRGQAPGFDQFQRQQGPQFERADAGNFDFDYQSSPGFQNALQTGLSAVEGRHAAQGSRFSGGASKDLVDYATQAATQDYGNQYNRARGAFEADRGFGAGQANLANQFGQRQSEFGTGIDVGQSNMGNQANMNNYWQGVGSDINQQQYGAGMNQGNFQFGQNMGNQNNMMQQNMNNQNYWTGQGMNQNENQFAANYGMNANQQNYNMLNQQQMQQAQMMGGLGDQGFQAQGNYANMQQGMGDSLANAALGVGNANANRAMATQNALNPLINAGVQLGGAALGAGGK